MGLPKIPDSKEIAEMTKEAMKPMAEDIAAIKTSLAELVALQKIALGMDITEPVRIKESCH